MRMASFQKHIRWMVGCLAMLMVGWLLSAGASVSSLATSAALDGFIGPPSYPSPIFKPTAGGALDGHVIAIDPGHGGYDGGAKGEGGLWEKAYNLQIALKLRDALCSRGATVIMTRDGDYSLNDANPPIRKKRQDMERRAQVALAGGAEALVSIHQNEYRAKSQFGPQVFYRAGCPAGSALAAMLQANLNAELLPNSRRRANVGDFYINSLGIPSALVECGFLSNPTEEAKLRDGDYQCRIANAVAATMEQWFALEERPVAAEREKR